MSSFATEEKVPGASDFMRGRRKLRVGRHTFFVEFVPRRDGLKITAVEESTQDEFAGLLTPDEVGMAVHDVQNFMEFVYAALFNCPPDLQVEIGFAAPALPSFGEQEFGTSGFGKHSFVPKKRTFVASELKRTYDARDSLSIQITQRIRWQGTMTVNLQLKWVEKSEVAKLRDIVRQQHEQIQHLLKYYPILLEDEGKQFLRRSILKVLGLRRRRRELVFESIYRATARGGFPFSFHAMCDDKGPTITIFYDSEGNVFGGFNPESWSSSGSWTNSSTAFIFFLRAKGEKDMRIHLVKENNQSYAIMNESSYGPQFGNDLKIQGNPLQSNCAIHRFGSHYQFDVSESEQYFKTLDYEVFRVVM